MSRILYVDDELKPDDMLRLFVTEERNFLEAEFELFNAPDARRLHNKEIKAKMTENPFIDVEFDFAEAVKTLDEHFDEYAFFIIDRNLSLHDYKEVPRVIDADFQKGWEGDYLFLILLDKYLTHSNPRLLLEVFYFLTANPDPDPTKRPEMKDPLEKLFMLFRHDRLVVKDSDDEDTLIRKISRFEDAVIKSEHYKVFQIFSKGYLPVKPYEDDLLIVLKGMETTNMNEQRSLVACLRTIFEGVKIRVGEVLRDEVIISEEDILRLPEDPDNRKYNSTLKRYKTTLKKMLVKKTMPLDRTGTTSPLVWYLSHIDSSFSYLHGESYYKILFDTFWDKSSAIVHGKTPTQYCLPVLVNMLMDILIWFHDFMSRNSHN